MLGNHDLLQDGAEKLLALSEGHRRKAISQCRGEALDPCGGAGALIRPMLGLGLPTLKINDAVEEGPLAHLKGFEGDSTELVGVEESANLLLQLRHPRLALRRCGVVSRWRQRSGCRLSDQLRVLQVPNHLAPDQAIEFVCTTGWLGAAQPLRSKVKREWVPACVVAVDTSVMMILGGGSSSLAALSAAHQIAEEISLGADVTRAESCVHLVERL